MKDINKVNENGSMTIYDKFEDPTSALEKLGNWFARSGMYGVEKVEQGIVLALHCVSQKKDPLDLVRTHHMIGGRLSMRSDAMLAGYRERGGRVKWVQFDDESGEGDTLAVERDLDLALSAQARDAVDQIDAALERIRKGVYGVCVVSGRNVPKERLVAIPWAAERVEFKVGGLGRR